MKKHIYTLTTREVTTNEMKRFNVRLDIETYSRFKQYCLEHKVSAQQVCEEYIKKVIGLDV